MTCAGVRTASFLIGLVVLAQGAGCGTGTRTPAPVATNGTPRPTQRPADPGEAAPGVDPAALVASLRLPRSTRPKGYDLMLRLSPDEERFTGRVVVALTVEQQTPVMWLHAGENLRITTAVLERPGLPAMPLTAARAADPEFSESVALFGATPIPPGDLTLTLAYEGTLPGRDNRGAYRQAERGENYVFTQFEATDARRAFPCFDEPAFKTPFRLTLEVPEAELAFANAPQTNLGQEPVDGRGYKSVVFAQTRPLPTYLVAFAVGPFEVVEAGTAGGNKTPVRIIVPAGRSAEAAYAAMVTGPLLERLEAYTAIPYPYEKLDHIAVPQQRGAMENPGLITYGTATILGDPTVRDLRLERGYVALTAHELGHIWFGDYVTTAWWDDLWLNESFATWISAKIVDEMHPDWGQASANVLARSQVMDDDVLASARRIRQPIASHHDIANAFDAITYQKGAAVLRMVEAFYGELAFRDAVRDYLRRHAHGIATAEDFLADITNSLRRQGHGSADVFSATLSGYLEQPGVPRVEATLNCPAGGGGAAPVLRLVQTRHVPSSSAAPGGALWTIPVCARYPGTAGKSTTACTLLAEPAGELVLDHATACPAWVALNADGAGYYRAIVRDAAGRALLTSLTTNRALADTDRLTAISDATALVASGHVSEREVLDALPALAVAPSRHLRVLVAKHLAGLREHLVPVEVDPNYRRLVTKLFARPAGRMGLRSKPSDTDDDRLQRPVITSLVAAEGRGPVAASLRREAHELTVAWLRDGSAIEPDMVSSVLAIGGRDLDAALWARIHEAAKVEVDRKRRKQLLEALGHVEAPALVKRNFEVVLADDFDPRESMTLVWVAMDTRSTRLQAYAFIKENFDRLVARLPEDWSPYLAEITGSFCDATLRAEAEAFFTERVKAAPGGPRRLAQAVESAALCEADVARRQAGVISFLRQY